MEANHEQLVREKEAEKLHGESPAREEFLKHYGEDDIVTMFRVAENIAIRALDFVDCWDAIKLWVRSALPDDQEFGQKAAAARPYRWPAVTSKSALSKHRGSYQGVQLDMSKE